MSVFAQETTDVRARVKLGLQHVDEDWQHEPHLCLRPQNSQSGFLLRSMGNRFSGRPPYLFDFEEEKEVGRLFW